MKHYLYTLFPNTLKSVISHYILKYGSEAAAREELKNTPVFTTTTQKNMPIVHKDILKAGVERHDDVVIDGDLCNSSEKRLKKVKPWDVLMLLGHGREIELTKEQWNGPPKVEIIIDPQHCTADNRNQIRTVNDVVGMLGTNRDALSKHHVLFKMIMCLSGGAYKQQTPSDCFARQMAIALANAGWSHAIVSGYKGTVEVSRPKVRRTGEYVNKQWVEVNPISKVVLDSRDQNPLPAKENIIYFHGKDGDVVDEKTVRLIKAILRRFDVGDLDKTKENLVTDIKKIKEAGHLHGLVYQVVNTLNNVLKLYQNG